MIENNPYQSPLAPVFADPVQRKWKGGVDSALVTRGLLQRRVVIHRPIDVTIEYFARGLRDRIIVDGKTIVSIVPILWLRERFDFEIPFCDGTLPASVKLKIGRRSLRLASFEIETQNIAARRLCHTNG